MNKLLAILLLAGPFFALTATADCPQTVLCPQDGEVMHNDGYCQGVGSAHSCEFMHYKRIYGNGQSHVIEHKLWVSCPESPPDAP